MKDNVVHHGEDIWITKVSVSSCSAMQEMQGGERNTGSDLELSKPCRELSHWGLPPPFPFMSFPSHIACPFNASGLFEKSWKSPLLHDCFATGDGFQTLQDFLCWGGVGNALGCIFGKKCWDKREAPGPEPTLAPQHSEGMNPFCLAATWPSSEAEYLFSVW